MAVLLPGIDAFDLGPVDYPVAPSRTARVGSVVLDVHTMLGGSALILIGFQSVAFAVLAKVFAVNSGLMPWTRDSAGSSIGLPWRPD